MPVLFNIYGTILFVYALLVTVFVILLLKKSKFKLAPLKLLTNYKNANSNLLQRPLRGSFDPKKKHTRSRQGGILRKVSVSIFNTSN